MSIVISVRQLPHGAELPLPAYETAGSAGMDLRAAIPDDHPYTLAPGELHAVPTGIAIALPMNYEAQIRPRSGLAAKFGVTIANSPGTIDSDYRGEIKVLLINLGRSPFTIEHGMRVAQMVIAPVVQAVLEPVHELDTTVRGSGGFGSTGQ